jgi:hypothetical protein
MLFSDTLSRIALPSFSPPNVSRTQYPELLSIPTRLLALLFFINIATPDQDRATVCPFNFHSAQGFVAARKTSWIPFFDPMIDILEGEWQGKLPFGGALR